MIAYRVTTLNNRKVAIVVLCAPCLEHRHGGEAPIVDAQDHGTCGCVCHVLTSERRTVTYAQAADIAGVSRRTINNWVNAGIVDVVRVANQGPRIYRDSLFRPFNKAPKAPEGL